MFAIFDCIAGIPVCESPDQSNIETLADMAPFDAVFSGGVHVPVLLLVYQGFGRYPNWGWVHHARDGIALSDSVLPAYLGWSLFPVPSDQFIGADPAPTGGS